MSRLLFAAARGARIQFFADIGLGEYNWQFINRLPIPTPPETYRIHPDDEALQFGPVSTALRWEAEHFREKHYLMQQYTSAAIVSNATDSDWELPMEDRDIVLFLLILSEALADEGL